MQTKVSGSANVTSASRRSIAAATAIALAATLGFGSTGAIAGACKKTDRLTSQNEDGGAWPVNVHTTVHNKTRYTNFDVVIAQDGTIKQEATIAPSGNSTMIGKLVRNTKGGTFSAEITPAGEADKKSVCSYRVATISGATEWSLVKGADTACDGSLQISCDKSYHEGKERWNTTFVISD